MQRGNWAPGADGPPARAEYFSPGRQARSSSPDPVRCCATRDLQGRHDRTGARELGPRTSEGGRHPAPSTRERTRERSWARNWARNVIRDVESQIAHLLIQTRSVSSSIPCSCRFYIRSAGAVSQPGGPARHGRSQLARAPGTARDSRLMGIISRLSSSPGSRRRHADPARCGCGGGEPGEHPDRHRVSFSVWRRSACCRPRSTC